MPMSRKMPPLSDGRFASPENSCSLKAAFSAFRCFPLDKAALRYASTFEVILASWLRHNSLSRNGLIQQPGALQVLRTRFERKALEGFTWPYLLIPFEALALDIG